MFGFNTADKFTCAECPTEVVIGSEAQVYSRDALDQRAAKLCSRCREKRKEKAA